MGLASQFVSGTFASWEMYFLIVPDTGLAGPRITTAKRDRIVGFPIMNTIEPIPIFLLAEAVLQRLPPGGLYCHGAISEAPVP